MQILMSRLLNISNYNRHATILLKTRGHTTLYDQRYPRYPDLLYFWGLFMGTCRKMAALSRFCANCEIFDFLSVLIHGVNQNSGIWRLYLKNVIWSPPCTYAKASAYACIATCEHFTLQNAGFTKKIQMRGAGRVFNIFSKFQKGDAQNRLNFHIFW